MFDCNEYIKRRKSFCELLDDDSLAILFSGVLEENSHAFVSNRNFFYLTGIEDENSILLIRKSDGRVEETLFVPGYNPMIEKRVGQRLAFFDASKISGIQNVLSSDTYESEIDLAVKGKKNGASRINKVFLDLNVKNLFDGKRKIGELGELLQMNYSWVQIKDLSPLLTTLRFVKSNDEIEAIKEGIKKLSVHQTSFFAEFRKFKNEYEVGSFYDYRIKSFDNTKISRNTYVAAGINACTYRYDKQNRQLINGEVFVVDVAIKNEEEVITYARTYPVNGKFNDWQKIIYKIILDSFKYIVGEIKPGVNLNYLNDILYKKMTLGLQNSTVIQKNDDVRKYVIRNCIKSIGLNENDPIIDNLILKDGTILTVDIGYFLNEYSLGMRMKDMIYVTEGGCFVLTNGFLREIKDIENNLVRK